MGKGRLEAFSDGVLAIIITIMVLELRTPHEATLAALQPLVPVLLSYALSYVFVGIYWNNHHHLLAASRHVDGKILWANLHLLFWLSLVPFTTRWMGESRFAPLPVATYGVVLLLAALAYSLLTRCLIARHGDDSTLAAAIGVDRKGWFSIMLYVAGIAVAFFYPRIAGALYCIVALIWLTPDPRIERRLRASEKTE